MNKLSQNEYLRLRKLVFRNARPLDYTMWRFLFENGSCDDFLSVLSSYQNEDGGFGHNIECNNWNPNSSPYTVCIALDYLDAAESDCGRVKKAIISGILKYLASGEFLYADGWTGMQGVPSNNDYAHLPWLHFDPGKAEEADIGVTKKLSDFILTYAEKGSELYTKAKAFKEKYKDYGTIMLGGVPDLDPTALNMKEYNPETWPFWIPLPLYFVGSPKSELYPQLKAVVDMNLDAVAAKLNNTGEITFASDNDLLEFEKNNPRTDGKRWCVPEQTIGNYYWGSHHIVCDLSILKKFDRLDFTLPISGI